MSERLRGGAVHKSKKQNKQEKTEISVQFEKERPGQEHEVLGDVAEWDVVEPEGGQDTQPQELSEKMITDSEKEAIIQQFREWELYEAAVVQFVEDDGDDVEQKTQWFLDMLPGTHEQRQMIAPMMR